MQKFRYLAEVVFDGNITQASISKWNGKPVRAHFPVGEDDLGDSYICTFNKKADCIKFIRNLCADSVPIEDLTKTA